MHELTSYPQQNNCTASYALLIVLLLILIRSCYIHCECCSLRARSCAAVLHAAVHTTKRTALTAAVGAHTLALEALHCSCCVPAAAASVSTSAAAVVLGTAVVAAAAVAVAVTRQLVCR
jgi:hypothetical protein